MSVQLGYHNDELPVRPGLFLAQYYTLFLVCTGTVLSVAASARQFIEAPGPQSPATALSGRCYALTVDSTEYLPLPVPKEIVLSGERDTTSVLAPAVWYRARIVAGPTSDPRRGYTLDTPHWRPVGRDSLDVQILGWPVTMRMRLATDGQVVSGRLVAFGDVSQVLPFNGSLHMTNWPRVREVRARQILCHGAPAV